MKICLERSLLRRQIAPLKLNSLCGIGKLHWSGPIDQEALSLVHRQIEVSNYQFEDNDSFAVATSLRLTREQEQTLSQSAPFLVMYGNDRSVLLMLAIAIDLALDHGRSCSAKKQMIRQAIFHLKSSESLNIDFALTKG